MILIDVGHLQYLLNHCPNYSNWEQQTPEARVLFEMGRVLREVEHSLNSANREILKLRSQIDSIRCTTHTECQENPEMGIACVLDAARKAVSTPR
jgi:hypothetical protein